MSPPPAEPTADISNALAAERQTRFLYAILTSGVSKVSALLVQILALPLALRVFGEDRYTAFLTLQSLVGWISIFGLGLVPSLPKFIAVARAADDRQWERNLVMSAIAAMLVISILVFAGLSLLGAIVSPARLVSAHGVSFNELNVGYFVAVAASCLSFFASIDPAIRAGSQELHRANVCVLIANCIVLLGLLFLAHHPLPLWGFFVVLNFPNAILLIVDMGLLIGQRPYLARGKVEFVKTAREISAHSNNALLIQLSFALIMYIPTIVMAHLSTPHETAIFGSVALEIFFAIASMNLIFQPLTQAMANAHSHNDAGWVARSYRKSLLLVAGIGLLATILGGTIGPWVLRIWLGHGVEITHLMGATFGFYFLVLCFVLLHFYILSAIGALPGTGKIYVFQGVLALSLGAGLCVLYGAEGMVLGLSLGLTSVGWFFRLVVRRELKAMALSHPS